MGISESGIIDDRRLQASKIEWSPELSAEFGESFQTATHNYHELDLFSDQSLIRLLDHYPRERLQCFTMGDDPAKPEQWQAVCIDGVNGEALFQALQRGTLWLNVTNLDHHDWRYADIIHDMYRHIGDTCEHVDKVMPYYNTLTLASPGSQFYFHINPETNMIWNMRGQMTVSMLPAMDFKYVSQELLEDIFAREASGSIAYKAEFAPDLKSLNVSGGQCAWWPQTAPIAMRYHKLCVSLVTSYFCPVKSKREYVQLANRYLLRDLGIKNRSVAETGIASTLKQVSFRAVRKLKPFQKSYDFTDSYVTNLRVNLNAEGCIEHLDKPVIPAFCRLKSLDSFDVEQPAANS